MGARLSIAVACIAAYAGVIDVKTLTSESSIQVAKWALLGAAVAASAVGALMVFLASQYKAMIVNGDFKLDGA